MPARSRAYWKGYLRLSLVTIGVELYAATASAEGTALHQIHKPSGKRVRYEKIVPGIGPIETSDIVKGFEIGEDTYVVLEPDEIDEIKLESRRTIDLVQFVDREDIDPRYFEKPYYLVPEGDVSTDGFVVIREALAATKKVALGKLAMRGRESIVAIMPWRKGLLCETLRYAPELRDAAPYFDAIPNVKLDAELVGLAKELIARKSKPFDAAAFKDSYAEALAGLVEQKRAGHAIVATGPEEKRPPAKVIDLMEALKRSVGEGGRGAGPEKAGKEPPRAPAKGGKTGAAGSSRRKQSARRRA